MPEFPPLHRKRLRRREDRGDVRFLTFSCYHRLSLFQNDEIKDVFVDHLTLACGSPHIRLIGWVVMPEHVHLLVQPDVEHLTIPQFLRPLKRFFAARVLRRWRDLKAPILDRLTAGDGTRFWQAGGGYDRNIFSDDELEEKIDYIHENPVVRGLVDLAVEWKWSSARSYAGLDYSGPLIEHAE